jgi:rod shape-determining protein MreC
MESLSDFLRKYSRLLLYLLLLFLSLWLFILQNRFQRVVVFNWLRSAEFAVMERIALWRNYFYLRQHNEVLSRENARLRAQLLADRYRLYQGGRLRMDTILRQVYTYYPAEVVNITTNRQNNYMTLNVGAKQGVKPDMGVITAEGIAGIVKMVSPHYAVALTLLHSKARIPVRLKKSNHFGTLEWPGGSPYHLLLNYLPSHVEYQVGDTVVVAHLSTVFPSGYPVGLVSGGRQNAEEGYLTLDVRPFVDFHSLRYVYLVDFTDRYEVELLEKTAAGDE